MVSSLGDSQVLQPTAGQGLQQLKTTAPTSSSAKQRGQPSKNKPSTSSGLAGVVAGETSICTVGLGTGENFFIINVHAVSAAHLLNRRADQSKPLSSSPKRIFENVPWNLCVAIG